MDFALNVQVGGSYAVSRHRRNVRHSCGCVPERGTLAVIVSEGAKVKVGFVKAGVLKVRISEQRTLKISLCEVGADQAAPNELGGRKLCLAKTNAVKVKSREVRAGVLVGELSAVSAVRLHPALVQFQQTLERVGGRVRSWGGCHFSLFQTLRAQRCRARPNFLSVTHNYNRSADESTCSRDSRIGDSRV